ncbi:MAG TPA: hypothetical protein VMW65_00385 [Chloroflexota bacterium]|nr:hypothetical protein [Chloroflexota bacterium]
MLRLMLTTHLWTLTKHGHHIEGVMSDDSPYGAEIEVLVDDVPDARNHQTTLEKAVRLAAKARCQLEARGWHDEEDPAEPESARGRTH